MNDGYGYSHRIFLDGTAAENLQELHLALHLLKNAYNDAGFDGHPPVEMSRIFDKSQIVYSTGERVDPNMPETLFAMLFWDDEATT